MGHGSEALPTTGKDAAPRSALQQGFQHSQLTMATWGKTFTPSKEFLSEAHWKIDALYFPLAN